MWCGKNFSAPCIWANSEFLEAPYSQIAQQVHDAKAAWPHPVPASSRTHQMHLLDFDPRTIIERGITAFQKNHVIIQNPKYPKNLE
jgi:hypothetical protein